MQNRRGVSGTITSHRLINAAQTMFNNGILIWYGEINNFGQDPGMATSTFHTISTTLFQDKRMSNNAACYK
jgi:hypothetical protein